jgi:hypothetical protein
MRRRPTVAEREIPPIVQAALDGVTRHLRARNWTPVMRHHCDCNPEALCEYHAEVRAVEHYAPAVEVVQGWQLRDRAAALDPARADSGEGR